MAKGGHVGYTNGKAGSAGGKGCRPGTNVLPLMVENVVPEKVFPSCAV